MNKEKQIEEMAKIIYQNTEFDTMWNEIYDSANALYNAGYRKASEVAREIFEEIEDILAHNYICYGKCYDEDIASEIDLLKKKYTEDKENAD
jgi:hypothetical protein